MTTALHFADYLLSDIALACGHQITVYREADLLIAVRRDCKRCDPAATVPRKKPSRVSVNSESEEEIA